MNKPTRILILAATILLLISPVLSVRAQDEAPPTTAEVGLEEVEPGELIESEKWNVIEDVVREIEEPEEAGVPTIEVGIAEEPEKPEEPELEEVKMDEAITAEDLGVRRSVVLPDNPLYIFKEWGRNIRTFFTFDPAEKAERRLQFANEKLIETQQLAEKGAETEVIEKSLENYQKDMDKVAEQIKKFKKRDGEKIEERPKLDKFLDKMTDKEFKAQKVLHKLEKDLPAETFEKIKETKEKSLEKFGEVALHLEKPEETGERIEKIIDQQEGSKFKHFKNLEVLRDLEEKVPEEAKEAIKQAQENAMKRLQGDIEKMSPEDREKFKEYVENIGGDKLNHLEIIHELEAKEIPEEVRAEIEKAKIKAFEKIDEKMKEFKTEEMKKGFLKDLERGKMEDLRIIKELEAGLAPETIERVMEIKEKAMEKMKEKIEAAETPEEKEKFFKELEENHDVKQMEILKEMERVIPSDKMEFWSQMKEKATNEMKAEFEKAKDERQKRMILEKFAGDNPEHIEIIKEFGPPPEMVNEILKEQIAKLETKIESIKDVEKIRILKEKIEEDENIKEELTSRHPEIFTRIEEKEEMFFEEMGPEKAANQIEKAAEEIDSAHAELLELSSAVTEASSAETKSVGQLFEEDFKRAPVVPLMENAQKALENARTALEQGSYGEAFGQATAALRNANNVRRIIKEIKFRHRIEKERMEKIEERIPEMEFPEEVACPIFTPPADDFCIEGKVIFGRDEKGCPLPPKCIRPEEEAEMKKEFEEKLRIEKVPERIVPVPAPGLPPTPEVMRRLGPEGTETMKRILEEKGMEITPKGIENVKRIIEEGEGREIKPEEMERIIKEVTPEIRKIEPREKLAPEGGLFPIEPERRIEPEKYELPAPESSGGGEFLREEPELKKEPLEPGSLGTSPYSRAGNFLKKLIGL